VTEHAPELAKRWPRSFWFLGTGSQGADALAGLLSSLKKDGKIGDSVAMVSVADGFGIDLATAARKSFKTADLKLVYDKAYPVGTQDFAPLINEAKNTKADTFVAFSYPPETFGIAEQSKILGFNPKVYYLGVGTAFVQFGQKLGPDAQGILGVGGVNADSPLFKAYAEKHKAFTKGQEPDRWASAVVYASLQMLQQAIERVGSLDKDAIAKEIASGEFDTVVGTVKMKDNIRQGIWWVGQWQDGEFHGIAPANLEGARKLMFPKPDWK
jgi:branched-chain amino acid transport system substrate-binding protein